MTKSSVVFIACMLASLTTVWSCKSNTKDVRREGVMEDSCHIKAFLRAAKDSSMADVMVSMETSRQLAADSSNTTILNMEKYFQLQQNDSIVPAVFCQPMATGSRGKYLFWVSFYVDSASVRKNAMRLMILPNHIIRDTVYYPL